MEKVKHAIISFALWIFVGFCLILAIGMPWGAGTILMLLAAVMAAPVKKIRKIWDVILDLLPQEKTISRKSKKRQGSYGKTNAKKMKALVIALAFIFGFTFGMAETESAEPSDPTPVISEMPTETTTEASAEVPIDMTLAQTTEKATQPPTEIPTEFPTETLTAIATAPPTEAPTEAPVLTIPKNSTFSIHFIDVGQADAALVECDGHYILIDGGNKADSSKIYSVLKKAAVPKLDIIVGTHAHEDHIGGIPGAFNYTTADLTLCPVTSYDSEAFEDFKKYAEKNGGGITVPKPGDTYPLGSATVEILGLNGGSDINDTSIILRIVYGETSFLFAGDAEREAEQMVLATGADLSATVLKVGHHGSDSSTTYPFLRSVMPQYAVISVGVDNSYGHPTEDTLSRLRDAGVQVLRTDMQGSIYCTSDGEKVTFTTERNADADTLGIAAAAEAKLERLIKESCGNYNAKTNRILTGVLTYKIISATEVEVHYEIDELIYADTEESVDAVLDEILNYVIADLNRAGLPEQVTVNATADYELSDLLLPNGSAVIETPQEPTKNAGRDYVANKNTKKFHYPSCSSVKQMKEKNRWDFHGTRDELINKGYQPCKNCNP